MPHGYDQSDMENAKEDVRRGKYDAAGRTVRNAKRTIEQHAIDYGQHKKEFDKCHDTIQNEIGKSNPSEEALISALDRMKRYVKNMEDMGI